MDIRSFDSDDVVDSNDIIESSDYKIVDSDNIMCGYYEPLQKVGKFTLIDKISLSFVIIFSIIYIILISIYPYNNTAQIKIASSSLDISISSVGLILSLFITSFVTGFVIRELNYKDGSSNWFLIFISFISFTSILLYYIFLYLPNNKNSNYIHYNHVMYPLIGTFFFFIQYTWIKLQTPIMYKLSLIF